jgi:hypothetical protein
MEVQGICKDYFCGLGRFCFDLLAPGPVDFAADQIICKKRLHEGFVSLPLEWAEIYSRQSNNLPI